MESGMSSALAATGWAGAQSDKHCTQCPLIDPLRPEWRDWKWQQRNAITSVADLVQIYPGLTGSSLQDIQRNLNHRRICLTPYVFSLMSCDGEESRPRTDDPVWRQLVPEWSSAETSAIEYNGKTENWELQEEMKTPICQHKYPNRVILRVANVCHSYCQFCYEALRTLEKHSEKENMRQRYWDDTLDYIRRTESVEEVILSGGEPLMLSDDKLDSLLQSLREIDRPIALRIHTRALTFNPFRIGDGLLEVLARNRVRAVGIHVTCLAELSDEFGAAAARLQSAVPILFANIPLLRTINDDVETMHPLCMRLYHNGIIPHYLYHFMPFSPGSSTYRTSVRRGIEIVKAMKRHMTNLAVPEFVLPHHSGKYSPPLILNDDEALQWTESADGAPVVRYKNWCGKLVEYSDLHTGQTGYDVE